MRFLTCLISLSGFFSVAQVAAVKKIKEIKLQSKVSTITVDRLGGFYTVSDCKIEQFSPEGELQKTFSRDRCNPTELMEAWPLMRIFAYQNYKQQFTLFSSHLEVVDNLDIDPSYAIEPQLAAPSSDLRHYWILDLDNSIKRISLYTNTVDIETESLKSIPGKFIFLRDYQNMLFLLHESQGIFVLNNLGNLVFKIPTDKISYFNFAGEDLYYLKEDRVKFFNIFNKDTYEVKVPIGYKFAIATDEKLILLKDGKAEINEFKPLKK